MKPPPPPLDDQILTALQRFGPTTRGGLLAYHTHYLARVADVAAALSRLESSGKVQSWQPPWPGKGPKPGTFYGVIQ